MHQFDILHVISDLHLGGIKNTDKNFQVFNQGKRLGNFIDKLALEAPTKQLALVLNGDIVDFLAENNACYLDTTNAIGKLERICDDISFAMVFAALTDFIQKPNRTLVILLGNHDVELAFPNVKNWFINKLTNNDEQAKGRIIYATDGAGFACSVKGKRVLCVHGNEGDEWNVVDYFQLQKANRQINWGHYPELWQANAGTQMVIDVMNDIKKDFPMVDLLKPEKMAAIPVVLALAPEKLNQIGKVLRLFGGAQWDNLKMRWGFLSAQESDQQQETLIRQEHTKLSELLNETFDFNQQESVASLLQQANQRIKNNEPANDPSKEQETLLGAFDGALRLLGKWLSNEKPITTLRKSLIRFMKKDNSFSLTGKDEVFDQLDPQVSADIDYLIVGHTHLARVMPRSQGSGYYYNSGTWIRLIELDDHTLKTDESFKPAFDAFMAGSLDALDAIQNLGKDKNIPLVKTGSFYAVTVKTFDGQTQAQLSRVKPTGIYVEHDKTRH
ncbi:MAG: metallophosphoesterase [Algicola sp.]|nr:metallophosphoesterase [Algicola sp.]